jgi:hypothetical protein
LPENVVDEKEEELSLVQVYYVTYIGLHENAPQKESLLVDIEQDGELPPQSAATISQQHNLTESVYGHDLLSGFFGKNETAISNSIHDSYEEDDSLIDF